MNSNDPKMQLLLPNKILKRLQRELRRAGRREIGGLLMGEHLGRETFRIVDISVQHTSGSEWCFIRNPSDHHSQLHEFFARTGENYSRFNYLGEWHSHPSCGSAASQTDVRTMQSIVEDPDVGVNFLVLLVCKRVAGHGIEATAMAFRAATLPLAVPVAFEDEIRSQPPSLAQRFWRLVGF